MKTYTLRFRAVNKATFLQIKEGKKKIETRAATVKYKDIQKGDTIVFVCGKEKFEKTVSSADYFKSIKAMTDKINFKIIMPELKTMEEVKARYASFPGYKEKIKQFGIVALKLK